MSNKTQDIKNKHRITHNIIIGIIMKAQSTECVVKWIYTSNWTH